MASNEFGIDMFTQLPPELIHAICGYLFPTHCPRKRINDNPILDEDDAPELHPLDHLAATCKYVRAEVNEWALHFLLVHKDITKYKEPKRLQRGMKRNLLRQGRRGLLNWSERYCVFCGKRSERSAILMNGLRCCLTCDKREWPDKITKTKAKSEYHLQDHHLQPSDPRPQLQNRRFYPRCGQYYVYSVLTTMYLRSDIEKLARQIHGLAATFPWNSTSSTPHCSLHGSLQITKSAVKQNALLRAKTVASLGHSARNGPSSPETDNLPTSPPSSKAPKFKGYVPAPFTPISPPSQLNITPSSVQDNTEVSDFRDLFGSS